MPYCFMKSRRTPDGEGLTADCPDSVSYLLLADTEEAEWGLYDYVEAESHAWTPEYPVSKSLSVLIESGKRYPPALALARQETREVLGDHRPSIEDLQRTYAAAIQHHLSQQHEARYVLAMALQDETIDLCKGEWYWVLSVDSSAISWVSDDFFVYCSPISAFDLTGAQLKRLN